MGPPGTGKTQAMILLRELANITAVSDMKFAIKPCAEVVAEYQAEGMDVIRKANATHRCFDDLGSEPQNIKFYNNDLNVMREVITARYHLWLTTGRLTHLTTNLTPEDIEKYYGERVWGRIRGMCNIFELTEPDRR